MKIWELCENRGRTGRSQNKTAGFSISRVRTVLVQAVCSGWTLLLHFVEGSRILSYVRPVQTACTRTAGHWILEMPEGRFRRSLFFESGVGLLGCCRFLGWSGVIGAQPVFGRRGGVIGCLAGCRGGGVFG